MHAIWQTIFYQPLLNILIYIVGTVAFGNLAVAVIILTLLVKLILFPLTRKSIESQIKMKAIEPEIAKLKTAGLSKEEQAKKTFELYKRNNVNPFSGCLLILIQLPIIVALYYVFYSGIGGASELLYSFVHMPGTISHGFLGLADVTKPSIVFAALAGLSQFLQIHWSIANVKKVATTPGEKSFRDDLARNMQTQMKYVLPVMIFIFSLNISAAVAIYWITSNIFTIVQELLVRRKQAAKGAAAIILP